MINVVIFYSSLSVFVEMFQSFEWDPEHKWKQDFICFFSSLILGFSSTITLPSPSEMALSEAGQGLTIFLKFCLPERVGRLILYCSKNGEINQCVLHSSSGESCKPRCLPLVLITQGIGVSWTRLSFCLFIYSLWKSPVQEKTSPVLGINSFIASQCIKAHCGRWLPFLATNHLEIATDPWSFLEQNTSNSKPPLIYSWLVLY